MSKTATETLRTQLGTEESTPMISSEQINERYGNSPIWIRGNPSMGYYASLGDAIIILPQPHEDQVKAQLDRPDISLIMAIYIAMKAADKKIEELIKTHNENDGKINQPNKADNELYQSKINATDTAFNIPDESYENNH